MGTHVLAIPRFLKSLFAPASSASSSAGDSSSAGHQAIDEASKGAIFEAAASQPSDSALGDHRMKDIHFNLESLLDFQAVQQHAACERPPDSVMNNFRRRPNYDGSRRKFMKFQPHRQP